MSRRFSECISLRQPWASLLVAGVKTVEWRGWSTAHRGPIWVHAAAATDAPLEHLVPAVTGEFARLAAAAGRPAPALPTAYPLGAVVGCVTIVDCADRATLVAQQPAVLVGQPVPAPRDSGASFGFVCTSPVALARPIKCRGGKDVFRLPPDVQRMCHCQLPKTSSPSSSPSSSLWD